MRTLDELRRVCGPDQAKALAALEDEISVVLGEHERMRAALVFITSNAKDVLQRTQACMVTNIGARL